MSKPIRYSDEPLGEFRLVPDFLPAAEEFALREEPVKVTLSLSKESLDFFKNEARRERIPYQNVIQKLLDTDVYQQKSLAGLPT
ncbi:MAG: CopG family transcriptional regulator [Ardenticatenaceae bacterium]